MKRKHEIEEYQGDNSDMHSTRHSSTQKKPEAATTTPSSSSSCSDVQQHKIERMDAIQKSMQWAEVIFTVIIPRLFGSLATHETDIKGRFSIPKEFGKTAVNARDEFSCLGEHTKEVIHLFGFPAFFAGIGEAFFPYPPFNWVTSQIRRYKNKMYPLAISGAKNMSNALGLSHLTCSVPSFGWTEDLHYASLIAAVAGRTRFACDLLDYAYKPPFIHPRIGYIMIKIIKHSTDDDVVMRILSNDVWIRVVVHTSSDVIIDTVIELCVNSRLEAATLVYKSYTRYNRDTKTKSLLACACKTGFPSVASWVKGRILDLEEPWPPFDVEDVPAYCQKYSFLYSSGNTQMADWIVDNIVVPIWLRQKIACIVFSVALHQEQFALAQWTIENLGIPEIVIKRYIALATFKQNSLTDSLYTKEMIEYLKSVLEWFGKNYGTSAYPICYHCAPFGGRRRGEKRFVGVLAKACPICLEEIGVHDHLIRLMDLLSFRAIETGDETSNDKAIIPCDIMLLAEVVSTHIREDGDDIALFLLSTKFSKFAIISACLRQLNQDTFKSIVTSASKQWIFPDVDFNRFLYKEVFSSKRYPPAAMKTLELFKQGKRSIDKMRRCMCTCKENETVDGAEAIVKYLYQDWSFETPTDNGTNTEYDEDAFDTIKHCLRGRRYDVATVYFSAFFPSGTIPPRIRNLFDKIQCHSPPEVQEWVSTQLKII